MPNTTNQPTDRFVSAPDGLKLHYAEYGSALDPGAPVVCLPGLTRSAEDFAALARALSFGGRKRRRVLALDYRGRGLSEWDRNWENYNVGVENADILSLLDAAEIHHAVVIGTSRGGLIGMFLAATAKDRLAGLCLNDIGPDIARGGLEKIREYVGRNPAAKTIDDLVARLPGQMTGFANVPDERWRAFAQGLYDETPNGLINRYDPALRDSFLATFDAPPADLWPWFDACAGLPLALIRGGNSDLLMPETAAEMRRRRPDMQFAEVPDRGHVPFLDEPGSLRVIRDWLAQIR